MPSGDHDLPQVREEELRARTRDRARRGTTWLLSAVGAAVLLWVAAQWMELWPSELVLVAPEWLVAAALLQFPYAFTRALRLRYLLDPQVAVATQGARTRVGRRWLYGSGLVSFLAVMLFPLRLGEFSRPLILAGARTPGVGLPESLAAVASERLVDGLCVVGLFFVGLSLAPLSPEFGPEFGSEFGRASAQGELAAALELAQASARVMAIVFVAGLLGLAWAARWPQAAVALTRRLVPGIAPLVSRVAGTAGVLWRPRQGLPLLAWTLLYWGTTVLQAQMVGWACGLEFGPFAGALLIGSVGLVIQLPGGPAQLGSFQAGMVGGLHLLLGSAPSPAAASFAALMYLYSVGGAVLLALPGAWLLASARGAGEIGPLDRASGT